jgi:hypothetical protein
MENIYLSFIILLTITLNTYYQPSVYFLKKILTDFIINFKTIIS